MGRRRHERDVLFVPEGFEGTENGGGGVYVVDAGEVEGG